MAQLDQELVRVTALQVVFDLLQKFGLEAFKVNTSVPELECNDASTSASEQDTSGKEGDREEENGEQGDDEEEGDNNEKRDDENGEEIQAPDTDTAASVLTILTGILESEVSQGGLAKISSCSGRTGRSELLLPVYCTPGSWAFLSGSWASKYYAILKHV